MLLPLMRQNVELNLSDPSELDVTSDQSVKASVYVEELDWGKPLPATIPTAEEIDLVLAADCVYFEVHLIPLRFTLLTGLAGFSFAD
jgi:hypothetical protein